MKELIRVSVLFVLVLTACAPLLETEPTPISGEEKTDESDAQVRDPVVEMAMGQLADNLGLNIDEISVVSIKETKFSDGCLGVPMQDVICAQVITPGFTIVLEANGFQYEYHVSDDGVRVQPATIALIWSRDGGFAGFCDRLTVFLSGEVYGSQCKTGDGRMGTFASLLSNREQNQLFMWVADFDNVGLDASDPKGVADGMSLVIEFNGVGKGKPGKPVQEDIFAWAQDLFQRLYG